jgi:TPR repeat protein
MTQSNIKLPSYIIESPLKNLTPFPYLYVKPQLRYLTNKKENKHPIKNNQKQPLEYDNTDLGNSYNTAQYYINQYHKCKKERKYLEMTDYLEKAIKLGSDEAMVLLANYTFDKNSDSAIILYEEAIRLGNLKAINNLAFHYRNIGNTEKAIEYFKLGIGKGNIDCYANLGMLYLQQGDDILAKKYLLEAIDKGDDLAASNLGDIYKYVDNDYRKMLKYYLLAIERGNMDAHVKLARYYKEINQPILMMKYLQIANRKKFPDSLLFTAKYYDELLEYTREDKKLDCSTLNGKKLEYSTMNGKKLEYSTMNGKSTNDIKLDDDFYVEQVTFDSTPYKCSKARQASIKDFKNVLDNVEDHICKYKFILTGIEPKYTEESLEKTALHYYTEGANEGSVICMLMLGNYYKDKDSMKSISYYEKAAMENNQEALINLGEHCVENKEYDLALKYYNILGQDHKEFHYLLGKMYEVQKLYDKAIKEYFVCVKQSHINGMYQLAMIYEHIKKDYKTASVLYKKICEVKV